MTKIIIQFKGVIQNSLELGSDDEHMLSQVFFTLKSKSGEQETMQYHCIVKQPVGSTFEEAGLEVSPPIGYSGPPLNYQEMRAAVQGYYRMSFGSVGTGFRITKGHLQMKDCVVMNSAWAEISIESEGAGW